MSSLLHERKISSLIVSLASIIIGIILIMYKSDAISLLCIITGALLVLLGIYYVITYFIKKDRVITVRADLLVGIILILVGAWMVSNPKSVIALLQYVVGAIIIIHGIIDLQAAINIRKSKTVSHKAPLLFSLITLILGITIIFNPFETIDTLLIVIGIILIFDGLSDILIINRLSKAFKQIKQESEAIETEGEIIDE